MDKIILAIQQLLNTAVAVISSPIGDIKRVFYGDPVIIPESDLPSLAIQRIWTEYIQRGSRYDQKVHTVEIRLIYNAKDYFKSSYADVNKVFAVEKSIKQIEDSSSRSVLANTVCGVIQKNQRLPYNSVFMADLSRITTVTYNFSEERGFPSYEVTVTLVADAVGDR